MLWATRSRYCDVKVGINQFWSLMLNVVVFIVLATFVYYSFSTLGILAVLASVGIYVLALFAFELFGPLIIRDQARNL